MSYYINLERNKPVTYGELLNSFPKDKVVIAYPSEETLHTPINSRYYKFLMPEKSSRGVQVGLNKNRFEIIIKFKLRCIKMGKKSIT